MQTIYGFSKTNTWIIRSFYAVLTRQTSEKEAFKSGFDNILEYFLLVLLPESSAKISVTGGGDCSLPRPPRLVRLWQQPLFTHSTFRSKKTERIHVHVFETDRGIFKGKLNLPQESAARLNLFYKQWKHAMSRYDSSVILNYRNPSEALAVAKGWGKYNWSARHWPGKSWYFGQPRPINTSY